MWRILFLVLSVNFLFQPLSRGDVEIFAGGHKYDSIKAYQAYRKASLAAQASAVQAALNDQQQDYVLKRAKELGINIDPSKIKTLQVIPKKLSDLTQHQLYVLSVESGVVRALQNFYQNWSDVEPQLSVPISEEQIQEAIKQAVSKSPNPKLIISQPGKLRIMAMTSDSSQE